MVRQLTIRAKRTLMLKGLFLCFFILWLQKVEAHTMLNSTVNLSILNKSIKGEARVPLAELEEAIGQVVNDINTDFFRNYFVSHITAISNKQRWRTNIENLKIVTSHDQEEGDYREVIVNFELSPVESADLWHFIFQYDVVVHQVASHQVLVFLQCDWSNGVYEKEGSHSIGVIKSDATSGKTYPLEISLEQGSWWKGFKSIVALGTRHISEGIDHLLFLLVLLLAAPLVAAKGKWITFAPIRQCLLNLLKVVTAFTIGHSITLLAGALNWVDLPGQLIEVFIAFSILVSAMHALRPVFPGKEMYVAAGFGLIHGLAFANTLSNLNLDATQMVFSILGFNIGIELMQLFVVAIVMPWLIILSRSAAYTWIRITGSVFAGVAAMAWMTERISESPNSITRFVEQLAQYAPWIIALLAVSAVVVMIRIRTKTVYEQINSKR
jgi:hypothetical protein